MTTQTQDHTQEQVTRTFIWLGVILVAVIAVSYLYVLL